MKISRDIMRKEDEEMGMLMFVSWFIFAWAYLSEYDRLRDDINDED